MASAWNCPRCTYENATGATSCTMCAHKRPSAGGSATSKAPPNKRPKPATADSSGGMRSFLSPVGSSKDQEAKKLAKKVQQMRELGIELPDDQIQELLARNCFCVHVAASEFFERMAVAPSGTGSTSSSNSPQRDERVKRAVSYFEGAFMGAPYRLLGSIDVRASITRANSELSVGDKLLFQGENVGSKRARPGSAAVNASGGGQSTANGIVRVSTMDHVQLGRLDREWEVAFHPLLKEGLVSLGGVCLEPPFSSQVFAAFRVLLFVYVHPRAFDVFQEDHELFHLSDALYFALDRVHSAATPAATASDASDAPPQDLEAIFSAFAPTPSGQPTVDVAGQLAPLLKPDFSLRPHQTQALEWMIWRETQRTADSSTTDADADSNPLWEQRSFHSQQETYFVNAFERIASVTRPPPPTPCLGGILADDMGMGKTVMLLSLVAYRRHCTTASSPSPSPPPSTSTALTRRGRTLIVAPLSLLHQWKREIEDRFKAHALSVLVYYGDDRSASLLQTDVVLTTYGVLTSEADTGTTSNNSLMATHWDRLILDEAHSIKNRQTSYFRASAALQATHRWCLTGTPLQNALGDVFSLLSFLRYEPWCRAAWWQRVIARPFDQGDALALQRLKVLLQPVLLRRTKLSRDRLGQRIVELPPKRVDVVRLAFSPDERAFYQAVFARSRAEFNGFVASGATSYVAIFALLLRLRQACDHPLLALGRAARTNDDDKARGHQRLLQRHGGESMEQYLHRIATQLQGDAAVQEQASSSSSSSSYVQSVLAQIREEGVAAQECPVCLDPPRRGVLTPCAHLLCHDCLCDSVAADPESACPVCRVPVDLAKVFAIESESGAEEGEESSSSAELFVSTKLQRLVADLEAIRAEDDAATGSPRRKVVVFSQWTHMLEMAAALLARSGFSSRLFHGALSQEAREKVLREFDRDASIDVLVISLKAGGVGLNLTCASVVVLLDPWWNPGVEEQAIDRVHRLGQRREVLVKRYVVADTVEDMILQLQQRKESLAKHVLVAAKPGGDDRGSERLSLAELVQFFR